MKVPAARPVFSDDDRKAIATLIDEALATGSLTLGSVGEELESRFSARHGTRHGIATSSGNASRSIRYTQ